MAQIIAIASLGAVLTVTAVTWNSWHPSANAAGAEVATLSIDDISSKVDVRSLPEQRIEDRTMVFVGP
jgi:hypothetical protein